MSSTSAQAFETLWLELPVPIGGAALRLCAPVEPPDRIAVDIARNGWTAPAPLRLLLDLATPGTTVLDLGAHLGTVSLCAARLGAKVIAVEASPRNAACLETSALANGVDVTVLNVAVGASHGHVHFREEGPFGQVTDDPAAPRVEALSVPEILERVGVARADIVKIDVEGQELAVLDGMGDLLSREDSPAVLIEGNGFTLAGVGLTPNDLLDALQNAGLRTWRIGDGALIPVGPDNIQPETVCDYLASRSDPPWPELPPLRDTDVVTQLTAEASHPVWSHRLYAAMALRRVDPALVSRRETIAAIERLLLDPVADVSNATRWWLERRDATTIASIAQSFHALADVIGESVAHEL